MRLRDCVVTLVGLGQMGASIGRALVARRACRRVIGVARKARTRSEALRLGAVHEATRDFNAACSRADFVLLATPARTILRQIPAAAAAMKPGSLLVDVGSTKGVICRCAAASLRGTRVRFVGGHPMAGQSGSGPLSSDPALFKGRPFVLSPIAGTKPADLRLAAELASAVQAVQVRLDPDAHDRAEALVSHLPHVIAVALMLQASGKYSRRPLRLAAGSFLGATRVAASDTDMLLDILLTNNRATAKAISAFRKCLSTLEKAIRRSDEHILRRHLVHSRLLREKLGVTSH
jgi:prephenate dehydrogenase